MSADLVEEGTHAKRTYQDVAVIRRGSSNIVRTMFDQAEVGETSKFMSAKDKVDQWELSSVRRVIWEHLYPLAKIVLNSETELTLDGKICNVIFKHMRMDEAYNGYSDLQKKEYRKRLWVVWRDLVSRNLDQKRHNQKGIMRNLFWGECKDVIDTDIRMQGFTNTQIHVLYYQSGLKKRDVTAKLFRLVNACYVITGLLQIRCPETSLMRVCRRMSRLKKMFCVM